MSAPESDTIAFLEGHVIFHGVPPQDLAILFPFLEFERFPARSVIIEESTRGNALYVITEGSVDVVKRLSVDPGDEKTKTIQLGVLGKGDCFGEMELLDTMARSASVIAREDTQCLVLTTGTFLRIFNCRPEAYPIIILNLARELSRRLRVATGRIAELEMRVAELSGGES